LYPQLLVVFAASQHFIKDEKTGFRAFQDCLHVLEKYLRSFGKGWTSGKEEVCKIFHLKVAQFTNTSAFGREMAKEGTKSCTSTEETELHDHLVDLVGVSSCVEEWMRTKKRTELWLEVSEGS
jgi:hypothetical protein